MEQCNCAWTQQGLTIMNMTNIQGETLNDKLSKLTNVCYIMIIDTSPHYYYLKLDKKSSYLTIFTCQLDWCKFTKLPFGVAPACNMFQGKINLVFKGLPNIFGTEDDILIVGFYVDGRNHDRTL